CRAGGAASICLGRSGPCVTRVDVAEVASLRRVTPRRDHYSHRGSSEMARQFKGTIEVDIRDSVPDWSPFEPPKAPPGAPYPGAHPHEFTGGTIHRVAVDVSGDPYVDLE